MPAKATIVGVTYSENHYAINCNYNSHLRFEQQISRYLLKFQLKNYHHFLLILFWLFL